MANNHVEWNEQAMTEIMALVPCRAKALRDYLSYTLAGQDGNCWRALADAATGDNMAYCMAAMLADPDAFDAIAAKYGARQADADALRQSTIVQYVPVAESR